MLRAFLETFFATAIFFFHSMGNMKSEGIEGRMEFVTWLITGAVLLSVPVLTF